MDVEMIDKEVASIQSQLGLSSQFVNLVTRIYHETAVRTTISLQNYIFEMFLENNLKDAVDLCKLQGRQSTSLLKHAKFNGNIILQIESWCNVCIRKDAKKKTTKPRLLKMKLTDGIHEYFAFESGQYPLAFDIGMQPCEKLLLTGNVVIRNGLLMLNNKNCFKLTASKISGSCNAPKAKYEKNSKDPNDDEEMVVDLT